MKNPLILGCAAAAVALAAGCGSSSSRRPAATTAASRADGDERGDQRRRSEHRRRAERLQRPAASVSASSTQARHDPRRRPKHLTVYLFEGDKGGAAPPAPAPARGVAARHDRRDRRPAARRAPRDLGTITRSDGTKQVTYNGHPLYFFEKDKDAGDAYGQGVKAFGADWYVLAPSGNKIDSDSGGGGSAS